MTAGIAMRDQFICRPFDPTEWETYRAIRLEALQKDPHVFGSNYEHEKSQEPKWWQGWIESPTSRCFGLFNDKKIIGCTGIITDTEIDLSGKTAVLIASYIQKTYRGARLGDLLYQARLSYAFAHAAWTRIIVSHREDNEASRKTNQRHGFVRTPKADKLQMWRDGKELKNIYYERDISSEKTQALKP